MSTMSTTVAEPAPCGASHTVVPTALDLPGRCRPAPRHRNVRGDGPSDLTIRGGPLGETWLRLYRPAGVPGPLPVIVHVHGGDAPFRDSDTQRLASRLAAEVGAAVILVDYSLAPTARVPIALEEDYAAVRWAARHGAEHGLDGTRIAVSADPSGMEHADELMLVSDRRGGPKLSAHVLNSPGAAAVLRAALAA
ncbi:hypothetical protein GCM10010399_90240 [Dactylosporangium fulvum]|uniref:Alpha/beta hydrolase fold domain-containing protein n=1 Tax=Dactylosporangium fulvum TaxID=53359 RepID=A0ABY5WAM8_9ACTN|nr:alpha/beta hydrolase fold domain-containing protein [Dactylosporangium fulvum]UWP87112.1 alpha/beta hydrolase fold domain-containing protein [Dactylosporangium fulvum]